MLPPRWYTLDFASGWVEQVTEDGRRRLVQGGRVTWEGKATPEQVEQAKRNTADLLEVGKTARLW